MLLVLVDFASTKLWTKDFDVTPGEKGGATLADVQTFLRDWVLSVVNHAPVVWWSDNGGQFKSVINRLVEHLFGTVPIFIPPEHPASNGLSERMIALVEKYLENPCGRCGFRKPIDAIQLHISMLGPQ